jgi:MFS family permease
MPKLPLEPKQAKLLAMQVILMFGVVSLAGDFLYEGARAVNGPYLKTLGASAALVGLVAGLAELLGYAVRLLSGFLADRTKAYWVFTLFGYATLCTVPLLGMTDVWQLAALFIVLERVGKAIRSPAKDTILSTAARRVGTGFGFGLHEAMDQIGAILGPLFFMALFVGGNATLADYQNAYTWMWIPFVLLMVAVVVAFLKVPDPALLEEVKPAARGEDRLSRSFWLYLAFTGATTLGFANWALLGFHFKTTGVLTDAQIPLFYAVAMGVDGVAAMAVGLFYDRLKARSANEHAGLLALLLIPLLTAFVPLLGFGTSFYGAMAAAVLFGVVMGIHETIMKSAVADITPLKKRGTGYGLFNTVYGLAIFAASALMGLLYDVSLPAVFGLSLGGQILALLLFWRLRKAVLKAGPASS